MTELEIIILPNNQQKAAIDFVIKETKNIYDFCVSTKLSCIYNNMNIPRYRSLFRSYSNENLPDDYVRQIMIDVDRKFSGIRRLYKTNKETVLPLSIRNGYYLILGFLDLDNDGLYLPNCGRIKTEESYKLNPSLVVRASILKYSDKYVLHVKTR